MANLTTLSDIAKTEQPISYYIITNSEDEVAYNDGTGNIVIYSNEDDGNHFYIGDEHIAGGYGFASKNEYSYAYNKIYNEIPQIKEALRELENSMPTGETGETGGNVGGSQNNNSFVSFNVDKDYKFIKTESNNYELQYDESTSTLSVFNYSKEKIFNVINQHNDVRKFAEITDMVEIGAELDARYISFQYEGNQEITGIYFTYSVTNEADIKTSKTISKPLIGSHTEYYNVDTANDYVDINIVYQVKDPELNPSQRQENWEITLKDAFRAKLNEINDSIINQHIIDIQLNVLFDTRKITVTCSRYACVNPVYYITTIIDDENRLPESLSDVEGMHSILTLGDTDEILTFNHPVDNERTAKLYDYILIPQYIVNKEVIRPKFIFEQSGLKFEWEVQEVINPRLKNLQPAQYRIYKSPHIYNYGDTQWKIKF